MYIRHLQQPDHVQTNKTLKTFDIKDHVKGWSRAKSKTASEPHGLSFAHYKSASKSQDMAAFDFLLREIPFRIGFSPSEWRKITNLQIYKKSMDLDVELMRSITLFYAEFNMNNKWLGK